MFAAKMSGSGTTNNSSKTISQTLEAVENYPPQRNRGRIISKILGNSRFFEIFMVKTRTSENYRQIYLRL